MAAKQPVSIYVVFLILGILIWVLEAVALGTAQFGVAFSFAETWGCRFWTIEMSMVAICAYFIIWTVLVACTLIMRMPRKLMILIFALIGSVIHLVPSVRTIMDYTGGPSIDTSEFCRYSVLTMAVATIMVVLGVLYFGIALLAIITRSSDPCEECN